MKRGIKWSLIFSLIISLALFNGGRVFATDIHIATVEVSNRGFVDETGTAQGSSYEIMNAIVEEAGFIPKNSLMPFPRVLYNLEIGRVDLSLLVLNKKVSRVAKPISYIQDVNFILVGRKEASIEKLEDIKRSKIGYLRLAPTAKKILEPLDIHEYESDKYTHLLQMLRYDRIDAIFGPQTNIFWALRQLNLTPSILGQPLSLYKLEMYLVFSKKSADDKKISALKAAAERLQQDGTIQKIFTKYDASISK